MSDESIVLEIRDRIKQVEVYLEKIESEHLKTSSAPDGSFKLEYDIYDAYRKELARLNDLVDGKPVYENGAA